MPASINALDMPKGTADPCCSVPVTPVEMALDYYTYDYEFAGVPFVPPCSVTSTERYRLMIARLFLCLGPVLVWCGHFSDTLRVSIIRISHFLIPVGYGYMTVLFLNTIQV